LLFSLHSQELIGLLCVGYSETMQKEHNKMKLIKLMLLGVFLAATPLLMMACEQESDLEEGIEEIEDEIDDATTD
jgi:hypothetical protein